MARAQQLWGVPRSPQPTITNRDGYPAYERPLKEQYVQTVLTNTLGNTYYADRNELLSEAEAIHGQMIAEDATFAAQTLIYGRNDGLMRLQPTFGLAMLSKMRPDLFAKAFDRVMLIPSDVQDFMTILRGMDRGQGGRAVKRQVGKYVANLSEYHAIKYAGGGRGYTLADLIKTTHTKSADAKQQALLAYLLGREHNALLLPQIAEYEGLKRAETDEARVAHIRAGRLRHEVVTAVVQNPSAAVWSAILAEMPMFATLRMLNALDRAGVLDANREAITKRLTDMGALAKSKILPFRFATAFEQVEKPWVKDVLRRAVDLSFGNLPDLPGSTCVMLDVSGSMRPGYGGGGDGVYTSYIAIGALFGLALWRKTNGNSPFLVFSDRAAEVAPSTVDSILSQVDRIMHLTGGGTNTASPVQHLLAKQTKVDTIILITDEQQNEGDRFHVVLNEYRQKVNRNVKTFVLDMAPYGSAVAPQGDKDVFYIYGWSDRVLPLIAMQLRGLGGQVAQVEAIEL